MKDIISLRNHLFDALNRLAESSREDLENEIKKADAIVDIAETIIHSAEVENQFIAVTKGIGSGFIPIVNMGKKGLLELVQKQIRHKGDNNEEGMAKEGETEPTYEEPDKDTLSQEELFDVDKEKNWLTADYGTDATRQTGGIPTHSVSKTAK